MAKRTRAGAGRRIDPDDPPYMRLRGLLRRAYSVETLRTLAEYPGFGELRYRIGLKADLDGLIWDVLELVRMRDLWEELLDAIAADSPRIYNELARERGWALAPEPDLNPQPSGGVRQRADVEIHISGRGDDGYAVDVEAAPAGDAKGFFVVPWSEEALRKHLAWLEVGATDREGLASLGQDLYDALFAGHVRDRYIEARGHAEDGLRLRLRIDPPELQALPWELLYDAERQEFLALAGQTLVTRYLAAPRERVSLAVDSPLRILLVTASPKGYAPLEVDAEVNAVREALAKPALARQIQLDVLRSANVLTVRDRLREFQPHVLHYIGHGRAGQDGGALLLEEPDGRAYHLPGSILAALLKRTNVRLAILNACLTSRGATIDLDKESFYARRRTLLGVGPALIDAGLGAVVAMQFSIRDWSARLFAEDFYRTLARREPVDEAVSRAREALMLKFDEEQRDWATPVLFLRAPDGIVFRHS